jgi:hypothetical protein
LFFQQSLNLSSSRRPGGNARPEFPKPHLDGLIRDPAAGLGLKHDFARSHARSRPLTRTIDAYTKDPLRKAQHLRHPAGSSPQKQQVLIVFREHRRAGESLTDTSRIAPRYRDIESLRPVPFQPLKDSDREMGVHQRTVLARAGLNHPRPDDGGRLVDHLVGR